MDGSNFDLRRYMFAVDIALKRNLENKGIVIVGDGCSGKSTLYDSLKGEYNEDQEDVRLDQTNERGLRYNSTLRLQKILLGSQKITLIDTPSPRNDEIKGEQIFCFPYVFDQILKKVKEVKFMLCVSDPVFHLGLSNPILDQFQNFISSFDCDDLAEEQIQKFSDCISLVITKATMTLENYLTKINKVVTILERDSQICNKRRLVRNILSSIYKNKRISLTEQISKNQKQSGHVLKQLDQNAKQWSFYDFSSEKMRINTNIFPQALRKMSIEDQKSFQQKIGKNKQFMIQSYRLLSSLIKKGIRHFFQQGPISYQKQFECMLGIIQKHPYGGIKDLLYFLKIEQLVQDTIRPVTKIKMIQMVAKIKEILPKLEICMMKVNLKDRLQSLFDISLEIFDFCRQVFCKNSDEEEVFIQYMLVTMRNLYECQIQSKIFYGLCNAHIRIADIIWKIIQSNTFMQLLIAFNPKTDQQYEEYGNLLEQVVKNNELEDPQEAKQLKYNLIKCYLHIAKIFKQRRQFQSAYTYTFKAFVQFREYVEEFPEFQDMNLTDKYAIWFKENQIYKSIGQCLQGFGFHSLAIEVYCHINAVSMGMRCYQDWIRQTKKVRSKWQIMKKYLKMLSQYGKKQKMIQVHQKMIDEFDCYPEQCEKLRSSLLNLLKNNSINNEYYIQKLQRDKKKDYSFINQIAKKCHSYIKEDEKQQADEDEEYAFEHRWDYFYGQISAID